jgi:hypothetical protein
MYHMCAEHVATETGTGLLWHAVDGNGNALCTRTFNAAQTPDVVFDREDYCRSCMNAVAGTIRPSRASTVGEKHVLRSWEAIPLVDGTSRSRTGTDASGRLMAQVGKPAPPAAVRLQARPVSRLYETEQRTWA